MTQKVEKLPKMTFPWVSFVLILLASVSICGIMTIFFLGIAPHYTDGSYSRWSVYVVGSTFVLGHVWAYTYAARWLQRRIEAYFKLRNSIFSALPRAEMRE